MPFKNFNFAYPDVLPIQINFCFSKLYFSLLVWTQHCIEHEKIRVFTDPYAPVRHKDIIIDY